MDYPISVAATPDKEGVLTAAARLCSIRITNSSDTPSDDLFSFTYYPDDELLTWVAARDYRSFSPGSAFSLLELEDRWQQRQMGRDEPLRLASSPFAASPIIFLVSPDTYADFAERGQRLDWTRLFSGDTNLRLMHAHAASGDGLAVVTAAYEAAGGSESDAGNMAGDSHVRAMESAVAEYGPDDATVVEHALSGGRWQADVIVLQERNALAALARFPDLRAVLVHLPKSTWVQQLLCVVEGTVTPPERERLSRLDECLRDPQMAAVHRRNGLRPLGEKLGTADDLALLLQAQPPSLVSRLTVIGASTPTPAVIKRRVRVYRKGASRTKRSADVCLVLDVSGSMQGGKLAAATQGVTTLLERLEGENPNASLILFSGRVDRRVPMRPVASGRRAFADTLKRVRADGGTALLDAVVAALDELRSSAVPDNLKVLLLFTDGQENSSTTSRPAAEAALSRSGVLFFGIGCGQDADHELLRGLAAASGGHSLVIGQHEIERVYATLSRHI